MPPKTPKEKPHNYLADPLSLYYSTMFKQENFDVVPVRAALFSAWVRKKIGNRRPDFPVVTGDIPLYDRANFCGLPIKTNLVTLKTMYDTFLKPDAFMAFCCFDAEYAQRVINSAQQEKVAELALVASIEGSLAAAKQRAVLAALDAFTEEHRGRLGDPAKLELCQLEATQSAEANFMNKLQMIEEKSTRKIAAAELARDNAQIHPFDRFCANNALLDVHSDFLEESHNWCKYYFLPINQVKVALPLSY